MIFVPLVALVDFVLRPRGPYPATSEHFFHELRAAHAEREQSNRAARRGAEALSRKAGR